MSKIQKKELYESIMWCISKYIKEFINEDLSPDKIYKNKYLNQWILFQNLWPHMTTYMKEIDNNRKIQKKEITKQSINELLKYLNATIDSILK